MQSERVSPRVPPGLRWSKDTDRVEILRPTEFIAGQWVEIAAAITIDGRPLQKGERLGVGVPYGFSIPRPDDPFAENYTTGHFIPSAGGAVLRSRPLDRGHEMASTVSGPEGVSLSVAPMEGREHFVWVTVESGVLDPGDRVIVRWGDRRAGSPGVRVPCQAFAELLVPCFREADENALLPSSPRVTVEPGPPVGLRAHLPGSARPGESVRVRVVAQDAHGNCPPVTKRVSVLNPLPEGRGPVKIDLRDGAGEAELVAPEAGVVRVAVRHPETGAETLTNPMVVAEGDESLYFGDIHVHTEISHDAGGPLDQMYAYARDVAGLDFAAATDHQTALAGLSGPFGHQGGIPAGGFESLPERWRATCEAAAEFNEPGRFVTFAGFEFAPSECEGHRNVYWLEDHPEMLQASGDWGRERVLSEAVRGRRVIAIPHHPPIIWGSGVLTGGGLVYGDLPDDAQPVVEIYSKHGTSEYLNNERPLRGQRIGHFVVDFLEAGHKFGFIGGSDTHLGNPGSPLAEGPYATIRFRGGLAAVLAPELTRQAIWEAICARRCYATTGAKIVLRFSVSNLRMGQEGVVAGPRQVRVEAHGEGPLILLEIVKNGQVIARWDPHRHSLDAVLEAEDSAGPERETDYYYARVRQHDGERAWSSPIWVRRT